MSDLIYELKGVNGQLELYGDKIVIKRKGTLSRLTQGLFKGDKTIFISQVSGIQLKPGGWATNGYIQFAMSGSSESKKGILDATRDENTVMFKKQDNELVNNIKQKIEEIKTSSSHNQVVKSHTSNAEEIMKYKQLMDQGIISQEEFNKKKSKLLDE